MTRGATRQLSIPTSTYALGGNLSGAPEMSLTDRRRVTTTTESLRVVTRPSTESRLETNSAVADGSESVSRRSGELTQPDVPPPAYLVIRLPIAIPLLHLVSHTAAMSHWNNHTWDFDLPICF
jgi:hypothetical protein